ncbi:ABC transporter permease [Solicola gregarius]|uniref:ABC transporter permease n=1 Tax=Solicola gregarius TaxID=2908642 RepID=A0AA46TKJ0_9ACTN|nr:ABC transporter permease [Solicola gregarius]UYM06997.1 ABC transporter permease [Solicola gregarius]
MLDGIDYLLDGANWSGSGGLWEQLSQQVLLTLVSLAACLLIGIPIALWSGHTGRGGVIAINVSNIGRAVPVFAVLTILSVGPVGTDVLGPFGRAGMATLISLVLFGLPPIITNAYVGMREVDRDVIESARGMGMTEWRLFRRVELPLAMSVVLTGVRIAIVQIWATATIAALVAGPGLGNTITEGFANSRYEEVVAGSILVAGAALVLEGIAVLIERRVDPMRLARRQDRVAADMPASMTVAS